MGRTKLPIKKDITLSVKVNQQEKEKIDAMAKQLGIDRSKAIRNIILAYIEGRVYERN